MKKLLKIEVCGSRKQCMESIGVHCALCTEEKSKITAKKKKEKRENADVGSAKRASQMNSKLIVNNKIQKLKKGFFFFFFLHSSFSYKFLFFRAKYKL